MLLPTEVSVEADLLDLDLGQGSTQSALVVPLGSSGGGVDLGSLLGETSGGGAGWSSVALASSSGSLLDLADMLGGGGAPAPTSSQQSGMRNSSSAQPRPTKVSLELRLSPQVQSVQAGSMSLSQVLTRLMVAYS